MQTFTWARWAAALCIVGALGLGACQSGDGPEASGDHGAPDATLDAAHDGDEGDAAGPVEDAADRTGDAPTDDAPSDAQSPDGQTGDTLSPPSDAPDSSPPDELDPAKSGETDGSAVIVTPEAIEGIFLYGFGVSPNHPLAMLGSSAAGIVGLPSIISLEDDRFVIRAWDAEEEAPVQGSQGVVEAYPFTIEPDGRLRVDFAEPKTVLEIQLWGQCTYVMEAYELAQDPLYSDALLTWGGLETFDPSGCGGGWISEHTGVNVHYLRRLDANPDFTPMAPEEASPFGFFLTDGLFGTWAARLPKVGPDAPDGTITYYAGAGFPEVYRDSLDMVIDDWNDTFETVNGQRPFVLEDAGPEILAWDPRYRVIYWNDDGDFQGAIAPFTEDPFTGELFETDVIVQLGDLSDIVARYLETFEIYPEAEEAGAEAGDKGLPTTKAAWTGAPGGLAPEGLSPEVTLSPDWSDPVTLAPRILRRRVFVRRPLEPLNLKALFEIEGMSLEQEALETLIMRDYIIHEVGHNLGLRHNFKGSIDWSHMPDGTSATSVMDYVVSMPAPGTYDVDAMRYAYGGAVEETGYLYCSDEDVDDDPGCARWDYGHPVVYFLNAMGKLIGEYPPETSTGDLEDAYEEQEWRDLFTRLRQFVNTSYEVIDPDNPVSVVDVFLSWVACSGDDSCGIHLWFRQEFALYLLYTKYSSGNDWVDFPALSGPQVNTVLDAYFTLIMSPTQPLALKLTIVEKLPTANVTGADGLLSALAEALAAIETPTEDEAALLDAVEEALDA